MEKYITAFILINCVVVVIISEYLREETFLIRKNKRFLVNDSIQIINGPVESFIICGSYCLQYGEACCGGYYMPTSQECYIEKSGCCHAEWKDEQGTGVFHRISKTISSECKTTQMGKEYSGKFNVTNTDRTCQAWEDNTPHQHYHPELSRERNYCRNPDDDILGPWCYTTDPESRWEYCSVPFCVSNVCARECKLNTLGLDYRGTTNITENGRICQAWAVVPSHSNAHKNLFTEQNYCRNPDYEPNGPWCYTTNISVLWEYCDIPLCG